LAEAEVEYEDKKSLAIDVCFPVLDPDQLWSCADEPLAEKGDGRISVIIWTTTPWTLPANQAVALHPDFEYQLVQCETIRGQERLLIARDLLASVMQRCGISDCQVIATFKGHSLEGLKLEHPFYQRDVPIILGQHVTLDAGTGAVHTAPGHGQDDYVVGSRYGLPVDNPVGADGCFLPGTELFAGENVFAANLHVIEVIKDKGALLCEESMQHSYPHCWRHKTPIIFRATPQWFISMDNHRLRDNAMQEISKVQWMPDWGQQRIEGMIRERPDWCISRQRTWGVPIAVFVHKVTGELHPKTLDLIEQVALRVEQEGVDAWFDLNSEELLGEKASDYEKITDTLDVWFDSGVTHSYVLGVDDRLQFPADLYLEGSDQHRGWFQSSLLTSIGINKVAPYKGVLTHGFTVDAQGMKMSKSRGNVVAPQQVMKTLGADILRLWVAATDYRTEMSVSDEILKRMADAYRKLRNTARYLLANLDGFDPEQDCITFDQMLELDRWALDQAARMQAEILQAYERYQFHHIYQKLHQFCIVEMSSFYIDIIKDRLYTTQEDSLPRRSAQTATYHIIEALVRWLAPVLSFTAEEIWQHIPGEKSASVFIDEWYTGIESLLTEKDRNKWQTIINVRDEVNRILEKRRMSEEIGSSLDSEVQLYCNHELGDLLKELQDELRFVLITSYAGINITDSPPVNSEKCDLGNTALQLSVVAKASEHQKCIRCWHHREDVGHHTVHPQLCERCIENIDGQGEVRLFA
jgi:isoleucyl-tRNA synthetase